MGKLEKLKKEREELDKRIGNIRIRFERLFEEGDEIYHVDEYGNVNSGKWGDFAWIDGAFSQGHIFRTKKKLKRNQREETYQQDSKRFGMRCNGGWEPDFGKNARLPKFLIGYSLDSKDEQYKLKSLELGSSDLFHQFGYFKIKRCRTCNWIVWGWNQRIVYGVWLDGNHE